MTEKNASITRISTVNSLKTSSILLSASAAALVAMVGASPAWAQAAAASQPSTGVEEVVVTATRITRNGYNAPTPTTVVGAQDIEQAGEPNIFAVINQLPSLAGSQSTQTNGVGSSGGTGGLSTPNLRSLGTNRTLVLLDGQRVVGAANTGVTDVSEFPQGLISRVDVVTGGASASWGSDAVAGVVNFILDKKYDGFKGNISAGETTYNDDQQGQVQLTYGTGFLGDRAHFEVSGEYNYNSGVPIGIGSRQWYQGAKILQRTIATTPAGQPQYIVATQVADFQIAPGGLITGQGTSLVNLTGTTFGQGGAPSQFQYGALQVSPFMAGGDQRSDIGSAAGLDTTLNRGTIFARLSYDLGDATTVYLQGNYGAVRTTGRPFQGEYKTASLTIQCDNPYLPNAIATACGGAGHNVQYGSDLGDLPSVIVNNNRVQRRIVVGIDSALNVFGSDWTWGAYYEHGENDTTNRLPNESLTGRLNAAIDAVRTGTGSIVCRSTVAQAEGCVPLDIIGTGVADPSAVKWVMGQPFLLTAQRQEMASVNLNGEPFSNWAGPVSIATGAEYREEGFQQSADACSQSACGDALLSSAGNNWFSGNFHASRGTYHVIEGFLETVVPLLKDSSVGSADLNMAVRATDYSTAGYVTTWKVGATYTPFEGLRFRALQSRDVRAPNLSELYSAPQVFTQTVVDDFAPNAGKTFTILRPQIGNTALAPEKSQTTEVGVVAQPIWFPGFSASVDYYRIGVKGLISTLSNQQEMDLCFAGNQTLCGLIQRNAQGIVTSLTVQAINLASQVVSGFDIESSYQAKLSDLISDMPGELTLRALATNMGNNTINPGVVGTPPFQNAGVNAPNGNTGSGSTPYWHIMGQQGWNNDTFNLTFTERFISGGVYNHSWVECNGNCPVPTAVNPTINNNRVSSALYLDIGGSYNLQIGGMPSTLYFKVDNVANADPAVTAANGSLALLGNGTNPLLYDDLGRMYHIGLRFSN